MTWCPLQLFTSLFNSEWVSGLSRLNEPMTAIPHLRTKQCAVHLEEIGKGDIRWNRNFPRSEAVNAVAAFIPNKHPKSDRRLVRMAE